MVGFVTATDNKRMNTQRLLWGPPVGYTTDTWDRVLGENEKALLRSVLVEALDMTAAMPEEGHRCPVNNGDVGVKGKGSSWMAPVGKGAGKLVVQGDQLGRNRIVSTHGQWSSKGEDHWQPKTVPTSNAPMNTPFVPSKDREHASIIAQQTSLLPCYAVYSLNLSTMLTQGKGRDWGTGRTSQCRPRGHGRLPRRRQWVAKETDNEGASNPFTQWQ